MRRLDRVQGGVMLAQGGPHPGPPPPPADAEDLAAGGGDQLRGLPGALQGRRRHRRRHPRGPAEAEGAGRPPTFSLRGPGSPALRVTAMRGAGFGPVRAGGPGFTPPSPRVALQVSSLLRARVSDFSKRRVTRVVAV